MIRSIRHPDLTFRLALRRKRRKAAAIVGILLVVPPQRFSHRHDPLDGTILEHWVWDREFVCDSPDSFSQLRVSNSYEALVTFPSGLRCRAYDFPFQFCLHESFIPSSDPDTDPACVIKRTKAEYSKAKLKRSCSERSEHGGLGVVSREHPARAMENLHG